MRKSGILFFVFAIAMMIVSCEKEKETDAPYVGTWETAVYDAFNLQTQAAVKQKVEFEFQNESVEALINEGPSADMMFVILGVRGAINDKGGQIMAVELNEVGVNPNPTAGANLAWSKKSSTDAAEIATYTQLMLMVNTMLPSEFDANYVIDGDKMDLIIPAAQDTIHLFKK